VDDKERLNYLLQYHKNLCEQMKCTDFFKYGNWSTGKTIDKLRACEKEINKLLLS
jgi:hypothetical protein